MPRQFSQTDGKSAVSRPERLTSAFGGMVVVVVVSVWREGVFVMVGMIGDLELTPPC